MISERLYVSGHTHINLQKANPTEINNENPTWKERVISIHNAILLSYILTKKQYSSRKPSIHIWVHNEWAKITNRPWNNIYEAPIWVGMYYISNPFQAYIRPFLNLWDWDIGIDTWAQWHPHTTQWSFFMKNRMWWNEPQTSIWGEYHNKSLRLWPIFDISKNSKLFWIKLHYNIQ